jgi:hypothetical protein
MRYNMTVGVASSIYAGVDQGLKLPAAVSATGRERSYIHSCVRNPIWPVLPKCAHQPSIGLFVLKSAGTPVLPSQGSGDDCFQITVPRLPTEALFYSPGIRN